MLPGGDFRHHAAVEGVNVHLGQDGVGADDASMIVDVAGYTDMTILGATRDDAAGECFDKIARVLGLPYPGGKPMDDLSQGGDPAKYPLPRAKLEHDLDMSFSGLKTAAVNLIHNAAQKGEPLDLPSLAASVTAAISDELIPRTMEAARRTGRTVPTPGWPGTSCTMPRWRRRGTHDMKKYPGVQQNAGVLFSYRHVGVGVQTAVRPGPRQVLVVGLAADHRAVVPAQGQRRQV